MTVEFRTAVETPGEGLKEFTDPSTGRPIYVRDDVVLGNKDIRNAKADATQDRGWAIILFLEETASARFEQTTKGMLGDKIAVFLDDTLVTAPTVQGPISDVVMIVGNFSKEEAEKFADGIRAARVDH